MGRAWQFFLTIAMTITAMAYLYYSSDYYAKRAAGGPSVEAVAPASDPASAGK
jgi:hypothetical protein